MTEIKDIQATVHALAKEKGWHDIEVSLVERIMLVVTELSEAVEEIRKNSPAIYQKAKSENPMVSELINLSPISPRWDENKKPEGVAIELADAVIRVMDIFESQGWSLQDAIQIKHNYNKTRTYRHGNKSL